ncbi:hypothetical protein CBM2605_U10019 [Cupriavidus neocaledonicus]|uniref:Uncharacterized protein n=1 Tax=Cupriavidus neocaledonicus TaxID=1040979 RepID=A0ABY1VEZ8_9BURK|nr:hypothetical protein CBM2605_U10019 [Cupriavidus neocaledonicus]
MTGVFHIRVASRRAERPADRFSGDGLAKCAIRAVAAIDGNEDDLIHGNASFFSASGPR